MMSDAERARAIEWFGYTPRQARFLLLVALHGGYFLRRQYVAFTGRPHGQAAVRFIGAVAARDHIRVLPYRRHGHAFHLSARPIYAAIGQEHNRNRRRADWNAVVRKLMTLDFVLARPDAQFWATEEDKAALLYELGVGRDLWPARRYDSRGAGQQSTMRYFVDKMPWCRERDDDRLWFTYVDADVTLNGFETYLRQYRSLLTAASSGVIFVSSTAASGPVQRVFETVIGSVTRSDPSSFLEYCRLRREIEADRLRSLEIAQLHRFRELRAKFATHSRDDLYQCWCRDGDETLSQFSADAETSPHCVLRVHRLDCGHYRGASLNASHSTEPR